MSSWCRAISSSVAQHALVVLRLAADQLLGERHAIALGTALRSRRGGRRLLFLLLALTLALCLRLFRLVDLLDHRGVVVHLLYVGHSWRSGRRAPSVCRCMRQGDNELPSSRDRNRHKQIITETVRASFYRLRDRGPACFGTARARQSPLRPAALYAVAPGHPRPLPGPGRPGGKRPRVPLAQQHLASSSPPRRPRTIILVP